MSKNNECILCGRPAKHVAKLYLQEPGKYDSGWLTNINKEIDLCDTHNMHGAFYPIVISDEKLEKAA